MSEWLARRRQSVVTRADDPASEPIGIGHVDVDRFNGVAKFGVTVFVRERPGSRPRLRGRVLRAADLRLDVLRLQKMYVHVKSDNPSAIWTCERFGMIREGTLGVIAGRAGRSSICWSMACCALNWTPACSTGARLLTRPRPLSSPMRSGLSAVLWIIGVLMRVDGGVEVSGSSRVQACPFCGRFNRVPDGGGRARCGACGNGFDVPSIVGGLVRLPGRDGPGELTHLEGQEMVQSVPLRPGLRRTWSGRMSRPLTLRRMGRWRIFWLILVSGLRLLVGFRVVLRLICSLCVRGVVG